ncbi:polyprenyl synthetase family protein [bacterium]|nr:polyprenyl synthetase family protein [bacterium]
MVIEKELNLVKKYIKDKFLDPLPNKILESFILNNSKFIRSKVTILYLKSLNIELTDNIYKILSSGEIIHSASLLHDDVIDSASTRRNKTTIAKEYSSHISILSGDFLLAYGIEKLLEIGNFTILNSFKNCTQKMAEAEIKQYFLRGKVPELNEYYEICKNKTALLFSTILENCANLAKIDIEKAKSFGELFGIAFQINNDLNKESANNDKQNKLYTASEILGIEKTYNLLDNYNARLNNIIADLPENNYKEELRGLINSLCLIKKN